MKCYCCCCLRCMCVLGLLMVRKGGHLDGTGKIRLPDKAV